MAHHDESDKRRRSSALVHASYDVPIAGEALIFNPGTGEFEPEQNALFEEAPPLEQQHGSDGGASNGDVAMYDDFGADGAAEDVMPNFGAAFVWPVDVNADDGLSDREWILQGYKAAVQHGAVRPLEVLESGAVVLLAPTYNATPAERVMGAPAACTGSQQVARANPFVLLTVQQLVCSNGTKFINTCPNVHCSRSLEDHTLFHNLLQQPNLVHRTLEDVLGNRDPLCDCASSAITALWRSIGDDLAMADEESFGSWFAAQDPGVQCHVPCSAPATAVLYVAAHLVAADALSYAAHN